MKVRHQVKKADKEIRQVTIDYSSNNEEENNGKEKPISRST